MSEEPGERTEHPRPPVPGPAGLCPSCPHVRKVTSARGSVFLLCELSKRDPSFTRYPPQPRWVCPGHPG